MTGQSKVSVKNKCRVCGAEVENVGMHIRQKHTFSNNCLFCYQAHASTESLREHLKHSHGHCLGYLLPPSQIVAERNSKEYPVNQATIEGEIVEKGFTDLPGRWLKDDFFILWDDEMMRPVMAVELLTKKSLRVVYTEDREEYPYKQDDDIPTTQYQVEGIRRSDQHVSHLATAANHRLTKEEYEKTFLLRNMVKLFSKVNTGILSSVEEHLRQVATQWWKCLLLTIPIYDNKPRNAMELPQPSHIAKVMFMGDQQLQVFLVDNSSELNPEAANFVAVRSDLEEVSSLTNFNIQSKLPLSWSNSIWKCDMCRFMSDDHDETKLHMKWDKNINCPVCIRSTRTHKCQSQSWELFKAHVEAAGRKQCAQCPSWFYNQSDLTAHVKGVHTENTIECSFGCGKKFKTDKQMQVHLVTHTPVAERERIQCPHCAETFLNQGALDHHIRMKHRQSTSTSPNRVSTRRTIKKTQAEAAPTLEQQLSQAQAEIAQRNEELAKKDEELAKKDEELAKKDEELAKKDEELAKKDEEIAKLRQQLKIKDPPFASSSASNVLKKKKKH